MKEEHEGVRMCANQNKASVEVLALQAAKVKKAVDRCHEVKCSIEKMEGQQQTIRDKTLPELVRTANPADRDALGQITEERTRCELLSERITQTSAELEKAEQALTEAVMEAEAARTATVFPAMERGKERLKKLLAPFYEGVYAVSDISSAVELSWIATKGHGLLTTLRPHDSEDAAAYADNHMAMAAGTREFIERLDNLSGE